MRINCPICGERDMREFHYLGAAKLMKRPVPDGSHEDLAKFHDYVHIRENPEGINAELWSHEYGCRAWLLAHRHTKTHEFIEVKLAREERKHL